MTIKHIVISGGGPTGLLSYGALKKLNEQGIWKKDTLETVYGSSIGGIIGVLMMLAHNWKALDDYLIKRPWTKVIEKVSNDILDFIENKGIDGIELLKILLEPLLMARELTIETTLKQLFDTIKIKFVLTATNVNGNSNQLEYDLLSHETYPDMKIYEALAITAALPMSFRPVYYQGKCYVDGGIMHNYPLQLCLKEENAEETEVLGLKNYWNIEYPILTHETSLLDYLRLFIRRAHNTIESTSDQPKVTNEIICDASGLSDINVWIEVFNNSEMREKLIERGCNNAIAWLEEREITVE
uniref:PNPLA domain-containing protein n=1 Tax=viral metagenome TaxID=1070528 RepID=A0A6C0CSG3_9ZZZZ